MTDFFNVPEFDIIKSNLSSHALSNGAKNFLLNLKPFMSETVCRRKMAETTSAVNMLQALGSPPLAIMARLDETLRLADEGAMLTPDLLCSIAEFAASCKRTAAYLKKGETVSAEISAFSLSIENLDSLQEEISASVNEDRVYDEASNTLKSLRQKIEKLSLDIKEKLNHIMQSRGKYLSENYISNRNGHFVLPVQKKFANQFGGTVIDESAKGSTVFIEPDSISALQATLFAVQLEEDAEVRKILYTLSALTSEHSIKIRRNIEVMELLDVIFAKGKYSIALNASPVKITSTREINIINGRHPLIDCQKCVPLNLKTDENTNGIVITGPNTGGKTVTLKTVGLFTVMAQSGLHIPCDKHTVIAMQDACLCDIGDSQNITQNLSTFSGHIKNVISILNTASCDSLVLLDELGSGTDPAEGMGIAVAVLEALRERRCMFLVTTHYSRVKDYAEKSERVISARMAFDKESLRPLYRLELGKSGESCALYIAQRLGLSERLIERAKCEVYGGEVKNHSFEKAPKSRLVRQTGNDSTRRITQKFTMGDSVSVLPEKTLGIVYRPADENGDVTVQIKGIKQKIKHTRLVLKHKAAELYPDDYDFSIIFESVENRKARHTIERKFDPSATVEISAENL